MIVVYFEDQPDSTTLYFEDLYTFETYDFEGVRLTEESEFANTFSNSDLELTYAKAKNCTDLMERAKIVMRIDCTRANGIPLGGDINPKDNKFMLFDTGLYLYESGLDLSDWIADAPAKFVNRGKLAEMFVAHELKKAGSPLEDNPLYYWHRDNKSGKAEVDFVVQYRNAPLPIKVKSGTRGSMKSLRILMDEKSFQLGIRTSEENFGTLDNGRIQIVPMYFIGEYDTLSNLGNQG